MNQRTDVSTKDQPIHNRIRRPIRLGLIGCGGIVQRIHGDAFLSLSEAVEVVALSDPIVENLARVGAAFDTPPGQRYTDYRDMLAKGEIDAVSIATPHFLHAEQATEAARAEVAVISEKPMATSLEEADAILDAVKHHNVPYAVVHNLLFSSAMRKALGLLEDGTAGRPIFGRSQAMFIKPATLSPADWRHSKKKGGGCIIDTAYHEIYAVGALMGSPVQYVEARVKTLNYELDVDDTAALLCEHENGAVSTVTASWCAPAMGNDSGRWCEVHTTSGSIRVNHRPNQPMMCFTRSDGWKHVEVADAEDGTFSDPTGHTGCFAAIFEALASGSEMPVTGQQARRNLAIIEAARRATHERRAIALD